MAELWKVTSFIARGADEAPPGARPAIVPPQNLWAPFGAVAPTGHRKLR
jgi:hypothetical protein